MDLPEPPLPQLTPERFEYVSIRWKQLNTLEKEWGDKAVNFLILINGGGAVAVLSFLGASSAAREMVSPRWALLCFTLGVIATGILIANTVHLMTNLGLGWRNDADEYLKRKLKWEVLLENDKTRTGSNYVGFTLGYFAFGMFIAGCLVGGISLFCSSSGVAPMIPY